MRAPGFFHNIPGTGTKTTLAQKISLILFGLLLGLLILESTLRLCGFIILASAGQRNLQALRRKDTCRILCIGESTTYRQYPPFLEELLNQRSPDRKFSVIDRGVAGTNSSSIMSRLEAELDKYHPDIVVAMMGINDPPYRSSLPSFFFGSLRTYKLLTMLASSLEARIASFRLRGKAALPVPPEGRAAREYAEFGRLCYEKRDFPGAESALLNAIRLNPEYYDAYIWLGGLYQDCGREKEAESAYKIAASLRPGNAEPRVRLSQIYRSQRREFLIRKNFMEAIMADPGGARSYLELGLSYWCTDPDFTRRLFEDALVHNPGNDRLYAALGLLYESVGKTDLSRECFLKAEGLRRVHFNRETAANYRRLKNILDRRGIRLVCVQYPMRSIEPLKRMLSYCSRGVIFVDNQDLFRDAVRRDGYLAYFKDIFGGDFGHCTEKGNRMLADSIARAILSSDKPIP